MSSGILGAGGFGEAGSRGEFAGVAWADAVGAGAAGGVVLIAGDPVVAAALGGGVIEFVVVERVQPVAKSTTVSETLYREPRGMNVRYAEVLLSCK